MPADALRHLDSRVGFAQRLLLSAIRIYQLCFGWMYTGSCRYLPTCSEYASEAIQRFGAARGGMLAVRRLLRCHPLGGHGVDPVPPPLGRP